MESKIQIQLLLVTENLVEFTLIYVLRNGVGTIARTDLQEQNCLIYVYKVLF